MRKHDRILVFPPLEVVLVRGPSWLLMYSAVSHPGGNYSGWSQSRYKKPEASLGARGGRDG